MSDARPDETDFTFSGNIAPDGMEWQCIVCGKKTKDRFGNEGGWDESCMLNSMLAAEVKQ